MKLRDALNANVVRRLAAPLRHSMPGVYARLNNLRGRILVGGAGVGAYQANAVKRFVDAARPRSARVLELGSDPDMRVLRMLVREGVAEACGVNLIADERTADGATLRRADAAALPFDAGRFDHIFSVATLEHVADLPRVLAEAHRVLAPGGVFYASFGPIWSSGKGHHVRAKAGEEVAHHATPGKNPLPDFCHLLLERAELRAALHGRVGDELAAAIESWIFESPDINRLCFHEYVAAFRASGLELVSTKPERDPVAPQLRRLLEFRHPSERDFDITNCEVVLRKP